MYPYPSAYQKFLESRKDKIKQITDCGYIVDVQEALDGGVMGTIVTPLGAVLATFHDTPQFDCFCAGFFV